MVFTCDRLACLRRHEAAKHMETMLCFCPKYCVRDFRLSSFSQVPGHFPHLNRSAGMHVGTGPWPCHHWCRSGRSSTVRSLKPLKSAAMWALHPTLPHNGHWRPSVGFDASAAPEKLYAKRENLCFGVVVQCGTLHRARLKAHARCNSASACRFCVWELRFARGPHQRLQRTNINTNTNPVASGL